jgi:hypothetical protein
MPSKDRHDRVRGKSPMRGLHDGTVTTEDPVSGTRSTAKLPPSRDRCPAGWDADIWHLTLLFEQYARADDIELRAGRPVIYMEIDDLVTRYTMRGREYPHEVYGCSARFFPKDLASHCCLHWPPNAPGDQAAGPLGWTQKVEVIMDEFWSRIWDDRAVDHFRQYFAEYGLMAVRHWANLRAAKEIRQIRDDRDMMTADSKEG